MSLLQCTSFTSFWGPHIRYFSHPAWFKASKFCNSNGCFLLFVEYMHWINVSPKFSFLSVTFYCHLSFTLFTFLAKQDTFRERRSKPQLTLATDPLSTSTVSSSQLPGEGSSSCSHWSYTAYIRWKVTQRKITPNNISVTVTVKNTVKKILLAALKSQMQKINNKKQQMYFFHLSCTVLNRTG